jgi:polysaccharide chain length determinant protein (PEP-CTERM system associated)
VLPGKTYTPEEVLRILWHRKWLLIVPFVVASVCTFVVARRLPSTYRSEALIQLIAQRIPAKYVNSPVTMPIDERLKGIQQVVLSRSRLESIIKDFSLYPELRRTLVMEDVVDRMRTQDIEIKVERGDAFRVSYVSGDPRTAQKVAAKLASLFIDENTIDVVNQSEQTNQFLDTKLEDAKRRLLEQEKRLEDYRRSHAGELPSQAQANMQAIQSAQMQLQSLSESINRDRDRRSLLERQVGDLEAGDAMVTSSASSTASSSPNAPDATAGRSTAEQLEAANAYLQALQVRYKADHPDVVTARRRIRDLEATLVAENARRPSAPDGPGSKPVSSAEVLRRNRLRDMRADILVLDRQIDGKQADERRLRGVITDYQARVAAAPTRESELVELNRDYATINAMYLSLLGKREDSGLAADVVRQQIGEQFKILDAARVPERPFSPNRSRINIIGSLLGLGIGVALIGLLEYRDSTFKTEEDVVRLLELPVLALVPMMASERELRAVRRRNMLVALGAVVMVVSSAAAVLIWKLQAS